MVRQGAAIDLVWVQSQGEDSGTTLPHYREQSKHKREQSFGQWCSCWGLKPHHVSFVFLCVPVSFLPTQCWSHVTCQQQGLLYQNQGLSQKCIFGLFYLLHPTLREDNWPFLPPQGTSCNWGTATAPLPVNVSLSFLPGRKQQRNQGKLLRSSGQERFCSMLTQAWDGREFEYRLLDNKGLSPVHGPVSPSWTSQILCWSLEHCWLPIWP